MTRQVQFDPFGMRLAGYRMGLQDETGLQSATRQARQSDYDFNNVQPLQLRGLQRQDQYQTHVQPYMLAGADRGEQMAKHIFPYQMNQADRGEAFGLAQQPYLIKNLEYNDQNAQNAIYDGENARLSEYGTRTGDFGRQIVHDMSRYNPNQVVAPHTEQVNNNYSNMAQQVEETLQSAPDATVPEMQDIIAQIEQQWGMRPGSYLNPQQGEAPGTTPQEMPGYQTTVNPYTGQVYRYAVDPRSYAHKAFMPETLQVLQQHNASQNANTQAGYLAQKYGPGAATAKDSGVLGSYQGD